jgi:pyruvate/2-oxoglutarate dehydrogenase complex dihydrolipoamide dehydrogenase (E3) component
VVNKQADAEELLNNNFSDVILATGAKPIKPNIKGLKDYYWAEILYIEPKPKNEKIVVIGGGLIGMEIANFLAENENEVIIVELLDEIGRGMEMIEKKMTMNNLNQKNVKIFTGYKVTEIKENGTKVVVEGDEKFEICGVDKIVVAVGMASESSLFEQIKDKIATNVIGDASKPSKAQDAIANAYALALAF